MCTDYYVHDGLGSTMALVDSTGTVQNRYAYGLWGKTIASGTTGAVPTDFQYAGAMLDSSTGLYKMGERYYDPSVGRFAQLGSLGDGYAYTGDNPVNFDDISGLSKKSQPKPTPAPTPVPKPTPTPTPTPTRKHGSDHGGCSPTTYLFAGLSFGFGVAGGAAAVATAPETGGGSLLFYLGIGGGVSGVAGGYYTLLQCATGIP